MKKIGQKVSLAILIISLNLYAVKIADITHIQGQRENKLIGVGLVVGLNGTGDGGKFLPAIKPLASFLTHFGNPVIDLSNLKSVKNVAIVSVEAVIGENGAREGQKLDVYVSAIGSAKSLKGGRLLITPLLGPHKADNTIYALASGPLSVDPNNPTTATVKGGATMEQDVIYSFVDNGLITLVVEDTHASWAMTSTIAMTINEAVSVRADQTQIAKAVDAKNVVVQIPRKELKNPANFIAWIQSLPILLPEKKAQVTINPKTGTIVIDGSVTISPVTISYKGITISTESLYIKKMRKKYNGKVEEIDVPETIELKLLTEAMDALQIPAEDRIAIIRELARSGNLQGRLVEQK